MSISILGYISHRNENMCTEKHECRWQHYLEELGGGNSLNGHQLMTE